MMLRPSIARDHVPGVAGKTGAILGPLLAVGVVTVLAAVVSLESSMREIVLLFGINAILVVGFQVFVGNTGIVSFGHVAFMAIGAYAGGIAAIPAADKELFLPDLPGVLASLELDVLSAVLFGGAVAALVGAVTGAALMRLSGAAASIATLGLLIIVSNVIAQATPITRGPQALFGVPEYTTFGWVFTSLAVVVVLSGWFKWSRFGLRARAVRDQPVAAESSGVRVLPARLMAFVLSAFVTGVAGALYAMLLTAFTPGSFYIAQLILVIAMAIVGGIGSITGALTGAAVITVFNELLRRVENGVDVAGVHLELATGISTAMLGAALILVLRWRPAGLFGAGELQLAPRRPGQRSSLPAPPPAPVEDVEVRPSALRH